jgi:hypothetical protein
MIKRINLAKSLLILIFCQTIIIGQTGKITGKIKDSHTGDVLPGSNVLFK